MSDNNGTATVNSKVDLVNRRALCTVSNGSDWTTVTTPGGKRSLTTMIGDMSDTSRLDTPTLRLLNRIWDAPTNELWLTFDETKLFGALAARFPDMGTTPITPAPATLVTPTSPVAPAAPSVANGMLGGHPVTITISNDTPTASMPIATPTVAPVVSSPVQPTIVPVTAPITPTLPQTPATAMPYSTPELDYFRERRERMVQQHRERQMRSLATEAKDSDTIWEVKYYIPSAVSQPSVTANREPMFADLARRMRQARLLKFDGSCYYGRERHIPRHIGKEIEQWNARPEVRATEFLRPSRRLLCKWEAEPVTTERMHKIKGQAFLQLLDLTTEVYEAMRDSIGNADTTYADTLARLDEEAKAGQEGPTNRKLYDAMDRRIKAIASAISRARNELKLAIECADAFGEKDALQELANDISNQIKEQQQALEGMRVALKDMPR